MSQPGGEKRRGQFGGFRTGKRLATFVLRLRGVQKIQEIFNGVANLKSVQSTNPLSRHGVRLSTQGPTLANSMAMVLPTSGVHSLKTTRPKHIHCTSTSKLRGETTPIVSSKVDDMLFP